MAGLQASKDGLLQAVVVGKAEWVKVAQYR
jgi:hypothetical protein